MVIIGSMSSKVKIFSPFFHPFARLHHQHKPSTTLEKPRSKTDRVCNSQLFVLSNKDSPFFQKIVLRRALMAIEGRLSSQRQIFLFFNALGRLLVRLRKVK
ncbi:unnamed protein product [Sphenostylis stenocarpa]|uniref:Uncharacterized protein n=1 Tax=Sphenostylis stenocarpa TaxID=92480 RepID=A0AA86TPH7_9FABA|nr:unnamed protein product [Sphenostylis stenocarpa]